MSAATRSFARDPIAAIQSLLENGSAVGALRFSPTRPPVAARADATLRLSRSIVLAVSRR